MNRPALFISFLSGVLFAVGLSLGGMTNPEKVMAFLDIGGAWDPALAWVMVGATGTFASIHPFAARLKKPLFAKDWSHIPKRGTDLPLLAKVGNVLFGVGWGLAGFCPGPALASVSSAEFSTLAFILTMFGGFWLWDGLRTWIPQS